MPYKSTYLVQLRKFERTIADAKRADQSRKPRAPFTHVKHLRPENVDRRHLAASDLSRPPMIPPEGANPHPHAVLAHVRHKPAVGARKGRRSERRHLGLSRQQIGARSKLGAPYGTRTRVSAVKGRCPRPLNEGRGGGATYRELCEREQASRRAAVNL